MELLILDREFRQVCILDTFESLIWTERYSGCGDFEIYMPADALLAGTFGQGYYAWLKGSDQAMVVEEVSISTDAETGGHLTVSGRSLESLLDRRIVWKQTVLDGNLQNGVRKLLEENVISPAEADRRIPGFVFQESDDPAVKGLSIRAQYTGDNLYEAVETICKTYRLGFRVTLDGQKRFVFSLYAGADRSFGQRANPYVVFSPKFENITGSDYLESGRTLRNITLVAGEGEGAARKSLAVGGGVGLERRELYTDARDIQSESYSQQLNDDTEALNAYKQKLSDDQQALSDETKAADEAEAEYNGKMADYQQKKTAYENRMAHFGRRIGDYRGMAEAYGSSLTDAQRTALASRNAYKSQIEGYEKIISECGRKINDCDGGLRREAGLTYEGILQYERTIDSEEAKKSSYEGMKSECEQNKTEAEKLLPDYQNTLGRYEKMISKYEEIISDDRQALSEETKTAGEAAADYNGKMAEYRQKKTAYESRISGHSQKIAEYEQKIVRDRALLDGLYLALLRQRGEEKLSENTYTKAFTSEAEAAQAFVYGKDFYMGDIVQVMTEYGVGARVRVVEVVRTQDGAGYEMYPTFSAAE